MKFLLSALVVTVAAVLSAQTPQVRPLSNQEFVLADNATKNNLLSAIATGRVRVDTAQMSELMLVALVDKDVGVRAASLQTISGWYQLSPRDLISRRPLLSYDAEGAVLDLLDDPDTRVRRGAIQIALLAEEARAGWWHLRVTLARRLTAMYDADPSNIVRSEIVRQFSLRSISEPKASEDLIRAMAQRALSDRDEFTVQFAISAARVNRVPDRQIRTIDLLGHPSAVVRRAAANEIGSWPQASQYLGQIQRALDTETDSHIKQVLAGTVERVTHPPAPLAPGKGIVTTTVPSELVARLGQDPKHDERLKWFVDRMSPMQRVHSKVHDRYHAGWVLDDAVTGSGFFMTHDPLDEYVPQDGILESLVDLVCDDDIIFVAQLRSGASNPTELGNFLFTDYDVQVTDVLKKPDELKVQPGSTMVVTRPGGELTVEGHPLKLWRPALPRLDPGRYVFFGVLVPETKAMAIDSPLAVLVVNGTTVRRLRSPDDPYPIDPKDSVMLSKLLSTIREMKCR